MSPKDKGVLKPKTQATTPAKKENELSPSTLKLSTHVNSNPQTLKATRSPIPSPDPKKQTRAISVTLEPVRLRYDIPTLLSIGRQLAAKKVEGMNLDGAVDCDPLVSRRNLSSGSVLRDRSMNHQRNSSTISTLSNDSREIVRHPYRQPINAPQGTLAQSHAGFAKFLKEHSSPKHHRVTAGGRIVPMSFQCTAPQFKLSAATTETEATCGTMTESVQEDIMAQHQVMNPEPKPCGDIVRPVKSSHSRAIPIRAPPPTSEKTLSAQNTKSNPANGDQPAVNKAANAPKASVPQMKTAPVASAPHLLKFGPTSFDGISIPQTIPHLGEIGPLDNSIQVNPQLYNPQFILPQALPETSQPSFQLPYAPQIGNLPVGNQTGAPSLMGTPSQFLSFNNFGVNPYLNYTSNPTVAASDLDAGAKSLLESAIQEYESTSNQLSNLDRYLALHTWDIDHATKKMLVEQRIELVRKLDSARVYKEQLETLLQASKQEVAGLGLAQDQAYMSNLNQGGQYTHSNVYGTLQSPTSSSNFLQAAGNVLNGVLPNFNPFPNSVAKVPCTQSEAFIAACEALQIPVVGHHVMPYNNGFSNPASTSFRNNQVDRNRVGLDPKQADRMLAAASADVDAMYQKIEEAAKRKEPLDPYFKELARATALMNALNVTNISGQSLQSRDSSWTSNFGGNDGMQIPNSKQGRPAVLQSPNNITLQNPGAREGLSLDGTSRNVTCAPKKTDIEGHINLKSGVEHKPGAQTKGCTCARKREDVHNHKGVATERSSSSKITGNHAARRAGSGASSKFNSLGVIPLFDGASDSVGQASKATTATAKVTSDAAVAKNGNSSEPSNASKAAWFRRQNRTDPSPMSVRAFFQLLREEDREAIRKQDLQNPTL